jgi:hypothetical protein
VDPEQPGLLQAEPEQPDPPIPLDPEQPVLVVLPEQRAPNSFQQERLHPIGIFMEIMKL